MKLSFLIFLSCIPMVLSSQSIGIGHSHIYLTDPARNNREVPIEIYYPSSNSGEMTNIYHNDGKPYPLVCFAHGYLMKPESYKYIWEALVPEGFIVALLSTETGLFPSHFDFSEDIRFVSRYFPQLSNDSSSVFYSRIDTLVALMGHSMGGGCSVLASENNPSADALVTLAAFDTKPSAISAAGKVTIPVLIISGSNDRITKPDKHQIPIYNNLPSGEKTFINILGGSHCQMAMPDKRCILGEKLLLNRAEISMETQHKLVLKYVVPWLKYYLCDNDASRREFDLEIENDTTIEFTRDSTLTPLN